MYRIMPSAPLLACDILDDGFASRSPLSRRRYLRQALRAIDYPAGLTRTLAPTVARACQTAEDRDFVFSILAEAMSQGDRRQMNTYTFARWLGLSDFGLESSADLFIRRQRTHLSEGAMEALNAATPVGQLKSIRAQIAHRGESAVEVVLALLLTEHEFESQSGRFGLSADEIAPLVSAVRSVTGRATRTETALSPEVGESVEPMSGTEDRDGVGGVDSVAEAELALVLESLPLKAWQVVLLISGALSPTVTRRPVGAQILAAYGR